MPSKYWIKLYHEILDDPKMGRLPDRLWRRAIELFLMAGEQDEGGILPSVVDMAWRLRTTENELEEDLIALSAEGISIVEPRDGRWFVVQFANRQAKIEPKERMRRFRERKRKENYYGDEADTPELRDGDEGVTSRNTDIDTDIDTDSTPTEGASADAEPPLSLKLTPSRRILKAKLDASVFHPQNRRGPLKFPSTQTADKFDQAAERLNSNLADAIDTALEQGCTSVVRVVNYIAKWQPNGDKHGANKRNSSGSSIQGGRRRAEYKVADPSQFSPPGEAA